MLTSLMERREFNSSISPACANISMGADGMCKVSESVRSELGGRPYPQLQRIGVEYHAGVLTLRGTVSSYYMKQIAQTAAQKAGGAVQINNCLEVHDRLAVTR